MINHIRFQRVAEVQIANAHNSYFLRSTELAASFLEVVDQRLDDLLNNPRSCQIVFADVRRALLDGFPYQLLYAIREDDSEETLVILACVHERSDTKKWKQWG